MNAEPTTTKPEGTIVPLTRLQRAVARRMVAAKSEVPEFVAEVEVDMSGVRDLREAAKRDGGFVPSYNDLVVKAAATALRRVPRLNARYIDDGFQFHDRINIGVAVAGEGTLIVPTVFDADRKSVREIGETVRELAAKARAGTIHANELAGGTFTVSNLGMHGVRRFTAIINPPQAGILAVGAIEDRVVVREGAPAVRPMMTLQLTSDHRIVYGADAAEFLRELRAALEDPSALWTNDFVGEGRA